MSYKYKFVALGGTFDLLHKGHRHLLQKAYAVSQQVMIGITTDKFIFNTKKAILQNQSVRKTNLIKFLKQQKYFKRTKLVWLNDIYGPVLKDKSIQALIVSPETLVNAKLIITKRTKLGLLPPQLIKIPWVKDAKGKTISSTRIRAGEINSEGEYYKQKLLKISGKQFNNSIRAKLKKPLGKIVKITPNLKFLPNIITVGDITTTNFLKIGISPKLSIVDFFVERKLIFGNISQLGFKTINPDYEVKNSAGQISKNLVLAIDKALQKSSSQIILVNGEEDLAVIPAVLLSPLNTYIFYGQPAKGAVLLKVDLETKQKICSIVSI